MKAKKFWVLMTLCALASCALAQNKVDKFFGNLNGAVQIYERYEGLSKKIYRMRPKKVSDYGTIVHQPYARPLKSLTWSSLQIERQGPYLYVWGVEDGKFVLRGRHALTVSQSKTYDCYILRGQRLCHYNVVVVVLAKKGYVYLKDDNGRTLESYTFADR